MEINLNENEVAGVLDALLELLAFDNNESDIAEIYNKILKQTNIDGYDILI